MDNRITSSNQIRVGNLVLNRHKEVDMIRRNSFFNFSQPNMGNDYGFYGIELTEEWIMKLGFVPTPSNYEEQTNDYTHELAYIDMANQTIEFRGKGSLDFSKIDYVHEFQNLFYAVTKIELELIDNKN